jgi:hypothetical protein
MAHDMEGLVRERRGPALARQNGPIELLDVEGVELASRGEEQRDPFAEQDQVPEILARSGLADEGNHANEGLAGLVAENKPATGSAADLPREASFSRDLVDTYFRQMGNAELLSREQEVALAKRIEAAQLDVQKSLCVRAACGRAISSTSRCILVTHLDLMRQSRDQPRRSHGATKMTPAAWPSGRRSCLPRLALAWKVYLRTRAKLPP